MNSIERNELKIYNMNHKYRGIVLIFNHINVRNHSRRNGTEKDVQQLQKVLPSLGFKRDHIIVKNDRSYEEMEMDVMEIKFKYKNILEDCDCFILVILSHGSADNYICSRDTEYHLHTFLNLFSPKKFSTIENIPKLVFVQACRGVDLDSGVTIMPNILKDATDGIVSKDPTIFDDLLIALSSFPNHYSFRNAAGSWFIQSLCEALTECDQNKDDLTSILLETNSKVAKRASATLDPKMNQKKQISTYSSYLRKKIYFSK